MLTLLLAAALAVAPRASHPAAPALAAGLTGTVTDTAGTPLADVRVHLLELGRGTTTDAKGKFVLPELPSGTYRVAFSRIGYAPLVRPVTIGAEDVTVSVAMRPSAVELPEVQVTATPNVTTALTSPQPTSILDHDQLRVAQAPSLGETINGLVGVHSINEGPAIGKPVIRGLSSSRVLVLDNGQRIETQGWGDEHSPNIETADAERIEVIRGPASVLYGSDALGGVVNVVKRDLPDAIGRDPLFRGALSAAYSTNNQQPEGTAQVEGATGGLGFRASVTGRMSDDFTTPVGDVFNTGNSAVAGNGSVGYRGSWGSVRGDFVYRDEKPELHDDATATPFQRIGDTRAGVSANLPIGQSRLEVITGFERNRRREFEEAGAEEVASGLLANSFKADARFHHAPLGRLNGLVGVQTFFDDFTVSGADQHLIPSNQARNVGVYAFEQLDIDRWTLSFGARYDYRHLDVTADPPPPIGTGTPAQTRTYSSVVGNFGALFHVSRARGAGAQRRTRLSGTAADRAVRQRRARGDDPVQRREPGPRERDVDQHRPRRPGPEREGERRARGVRQLHQQLHLLPADRDVRLTLGRTGRPVLGSRQLLLLPEVPGGPGRRPPHRLRVLGGVPPDAIPAPERDGGLHPGPESVRRPAAPAGAAVPRDLRRAVRGQEQRHLPEPLCVGGWRDQRAADEARSRRLRPSRILARQRGRGRRADRRALG